MIEFSVWDIVRNLLLAARWTVALSVTAFVLGGIVGLVVLFARVSHSKALRVAAIGFIEVFQGTPLLMQLFSRSSACRLPASRPHPWVAASLALTLWTAAFLAEIWRGCVESVARGQWEASSSLAMNFMQQMRHVVLPQAMRVAIAPTVGFSVQVVKARRSPPSSDSWRSRRRAP